MFPGDAAAYEQHHEIFRVNDPIDSAAHRHASFTPPSGHRPSGSVDWSDECA
jgi:hypothetical protein